MTNGQDILIEAAREKGYISGGQDILIRSARERGYIRGTPEYEARRRRSRRSRVSRDVEREVIEEKEDLPMTTVETPTPRAETRQERLARLQAYREDPRTLYKDYPMLQPTLKTEPPEEGYYVPPPSPRTSVFYDPEREKYAEWIEEKTERARKTRAKFPSFIDVFGFGQPDLKEGVIERFPKTETFFKIQEPITETPAAITYGLGYGAAEAVRKPHKAAISVGVGAVTGGAGTALAATGSIGAGIGYAAGLGLTGLYGFYKYQEFKFAETPLERKRIWGGTFSTELVPFGVGARAGHDIALRAIGLWRTRGMEFIPPEQMTTQEVLTGKQTFPEAPPKTHPSIFWSQRYVPPELGGKPKVYRKTYERYGEYIGEPAFTWEKVPPSKSPIKLKESDVKISYHTAGMEHPRTGVIPFGGSEIGGIYTAGPFSPHFLRLGSVAYYPTIKPYVGGKPTIYAVESAGFAVPKSAGKMPDVKRYIETEAPRGEPQIPMIKSEVEAVTRAGTIYEDYPTGFYTEVKGVNVPIFGRRLAGETGGKVIDPSKISSREMKLEGLRRSYATEQYSLISPQSLGGLHLTSFKSPKSSMVTSSKIFSSMSYKPSKVSMPITTTYPSSVSKSFSKIYGYGYSGVSYSSLAITPTSSMKKLFALPTGELTRKKPKARRLKQPRSFTPSLAALALDLRGPRIRAGELTGLGLRKIPKKRKRRK